MRLKIAIVVAVLGLLVLGLGIGQRTIWLPPASLTATTATDITPAPLTVISSELLATKDGKFTLTIDGDGPIQLAVGRANDVTGWVGDAAYTSVGAPDADYATLTTQSHEGAETVPNPAGSDMWVSEEKATGELSYTWQAPGHGDWALLLSSDGTAAAPTKISMTVDNDAATPWAVPLMVIGSALLALAALLFLLAPRKRAEVVAGRRSAARAATDPATGALEVEKIVAARQRAQAQATGATTIAESNASDTGRAATRRAAAAAAASGEAATKAAGAVSKSDAGSSAAGAAAAVTDATSALPLSLRFGSGGDAGAGTQAGDAESGDAGAGTQAGDAHAGAQTGGVGPGEAKRGAAATEKSTAVASAPCGETAESAAAKPDSAKPDVAPKTAAAKTAAAKTAAPKTAAAKTAAPKTAGQSDADTAEPTNKDAAARRTSRDDSGKDDSSNGGSSSGGSSGGSSSGGSSTGGSDDDSAKSGVAKPGPFKSKTPKPDADKSDNSGSKKTRGKGGTMNRLRWGGALAAVLMTGTVGPALAAETPTPSATAEATVTANATEPASPAAAATATATASVVPPVAATDGGGTAAFPNLLDSQVQRIAESVASVVASGDNAKNATELESRVAGMALQIRTANYKIRATVSSQAAVEPVNATTLLTRVVSTSESWPRSAMIVTKGDNNELPQLLTLVQASARENYKLVQATPLLPGQTFPGVDKEGAEQLALDSDSELLMSPSAAISALSDRLTKEDSKFKDSFNSSVYIDSVIEAQKKVAADAKDATNVFTHTADADSAVSLRTADGGAMVVVGYKFGIDSTSKEDATLTVGADAAVFTGGKETTKGFTLTYAEPVVMYIPPVSDGGKITVLSATRDLVGGSFK